MIQLILNIEDTSLLSQIKKACVFMRGVGTIYSCKRNEAMPNKATRKAMEEAKMGDTIKCANFEEYLKSVQ